MKKELPTSTRVLEHVALFEIPVPTKEGMAHAFLAVDDYSQFAFMLSVEMEVSAETVLKAVQALMNHNDFKRITAQGWSFTLVLKDDEDLAEDINSIIKPHRGQLLFDRALNNRITLQVKRSFNAMIRR